MYIAYVGPFCVCCSRGLCNAVFVKNAQCALFTNTLSQDFFFYKYRCMESRTESFIFLFFVLSGVILHHRTDQQLTQLFFFLAFKSRYIPKGLSEYVAFIWFMSVEQIFCIFPNSIFLSFAEPPFHALRAKKMEIYSTNQINSTHTDMMNNVNYRQSMFISDMKTFDSAIHDFHSYVE